MDRANLHDGQKLLIYLGKILILVLEGQRRELSGSFSVISNQVSNYSNKRRMGRELDDKIQQEDLKLILNLQCGSQEKVLETVFIGDSVTDGVCLPDFSSLQNELSLSSSSDTSTSSSSSLFLGSHVILFSFFNLRLALANQVLT